MIRYLLGADTVIDPWTMVVVDSDASFASIAVSRSLWFYYLNCKKIPCNQDRCC